jgi:pyruvate/2-oxoglutarate dehydrogenase complex dihydrolipoamide acyltransferase (E2) component
MPQMGVSVAEGTIVEWRKRVGDWVEADEPIVEISTDKVETEIPSPATGRVSEILVEPGATVEVGALLARIDAEARPGQAHADEHEPVADQGVESRVSGVGNGAEQGAGSEVRGAGNGSGSHAPPISPVVRRMADEHGVDLSQIEGTGRRGRVTKKDLLAFIGDGPDTRHPTPRGRFSIAKAPTAKRSRLRRAARSCP